MHINAPCGGEGTCGKCRVQVVSGSVADGLSERLKGEEVEQGYRLACRAQAIEDVTLQIPVESSIDRSVLNKQATPRSTAKIQEVDFDIFKENGDFVHPVEKVFLELPIPDNTDNMPDVTRVIRMLKEQYGWHRLELTLPVIRKMPRILRDNDFRVTVTLMRPVHDDGKTQIVNIQSGDTTDHNYAVAMDIGTTTIYGQIIDLDSGVCVAEQGDFNGQISYGEDVISRIIYSEKPGGLETLQQVVIGSINTILASLTKKAEISREDISTITIAGNTTMTQLLLGIDLGPIRRSPYVPASTLYPPFMAATLGIDLAEHTVALLYPQVSSYVGGDIVAGVMGTRMYKQEELTLFLDIGTNAEIVIGNEDWLVCTACSAGPAFEGGGIEHGMRAARGAIEDFSLDPITFEPMLLTIGDVLPKGICGSGLITMTAVMFEMGVINNRGKFNRELNSPRIRQIDGIWEYVIAWADDTQIGRDITLTEPDIDNLIRAKGAIYSGCETLLGEVGLSMDMIEHIILAGGFGSYIDLEKAMIIGLLPEIDPSRVTFIGNGSLLGARMSSLTNKIRQDVAAVTMKMTNFELSETPSYMDNYIAAMFIPHTQTSKFPRLEARLAARKSEQQ